MKSSDLSIAQANAMKEIAIRHLNWANRLVERMQALGFPPHDGMFDAAVRARNALRDLHMSAHYAGVKHGVGRRADGANEWDVRRA